MASEIPEEAYHLFDENNFAHVATVLPDGTPHTTPVWVSREGPTVVVNTARGRVMTRNLERDPRVAVSVHSERNPYTYAQVRGVAELVDEGAHEHINRLSREYLGKDYPRFTPDMRRVIVRIEPTQVFYLPPRQL